VVTCALHPNPFNSCCPHALHIPVPFSRSSCDAHTIYYLPSQSGWSAQHIDLHLQLPGTFRFEYTVTSAAAFGEYATTPAASRDYSRENEDSDALPEAAVHKVQCCMRLECK